MLTNRSGSLGWSEGVAAAKGLPGETKATHFVDLADSSSRVQVLNVSAARLLIILTVFRADEEGLAAAAFTRVELRRLAARMRAWRIITRVHNRIRSGVYALVR